MGVLVLVNSNRAQWARRACRRRVGAACLRLVAAFLGMSLGRRCSPPLGTLVFRVPVYPCGLLQGIPAVGWVVFHGSFVAALVSRACSANASG